MEYHFTGTGSSPDFTFIADGIIDGTGKVIPYSAVKSTKVKRKGHESILTLETKENGTKLNTVILLIQRMIKTLEGRLLILSLFT